MSLKNKINSLPSKLRQLVSDDAVELNDLTARDENGFVDQAYSFRKKVIEQGFIIHELHAVYHMGWELDEWACIAEKDGVFYVIETDHGRLCVKEK